MASGKSPAERRAARSAVLAGHRRHAHGRAFGITPRVTMVIHPTSVTPPHELEAQRVRPNHHLPQEK